MNTQQKQVLDGHLLGDGSIERRGNRNGTFRIVRSLLDQQYLWWSSSIFKQYHTPKSVSKGVVHDNRTNKNYYNIKFRSMSHEYFTKEYYRWYPNNKKVVPNDLVLTPLTTAVWFADDGCVSPPKDKLNKLRFSLKIATHGFSNDEVHFLSDLINDAIGVRFSICKENTEQSTLRLHRTNDCRQFLRWIDPVFPLVRKSDVWRNPIYRLWEEIPDKPCCRFCFSHNTYKNGSNSNKKQKFYCKDCKRQFVIRNVKV